MANPLQYFTNFCHFKMWQQLICYSCTEVMKLRRRLLNTHSRTAKSKLNVHALKPSKQTISLLLLAVATVAASRWSNRYPVRVSQCPPVEVRWGQQLLHSFLRLLFGECFVFLLGKFPPLGCCVEGWIVRLSSKTLWQCLCCTWKGKIKSYSPNHNNTNLQCHRQLK